MKKRKIDVVVISDVHLGTFGCHAEELFAYLNSISPETLVLNGDIIDIWQFKKRYFPKSHLKVLKKIIDMATKGTQVFYITGNHDEMLRKFADVSFGNIAVVNKVLLTVDNKKAWIFHGDVFDHTMRYSKWIVKLGGWGYDYLIILNRFVNRILISLGRDKYSLSKKIKNRVKNAVKYLQDFEQTAYNLAIEQGYDYVICGHIHQPCIEKKTNKKGSCVYLNSGDWVENLTALEYKNKKWKLFSYANDRTLLSFYPDEDIKSMEYKELLTAITVIGKN